MLSSLPSLIYFSLISGPCVFRGGACEEGPGGHEETGRVDQQGVRPAGRGEPQSAGEQFCIIVTPHDLPVPSTRMPFFLLFPDFRIFHQSGVKMKFVFFLL